MTKQKIIHLFHDSIERWHRRIHYDYQRLVSDAILSAISDSIDGETVELPIKLPRQSGKTTSIVDVVEFVLVAALRYFNRPLRIGIFAPEKEQATTDFDRLKLLFAELRPLGLTTRSLIENDIKFPTKWNSKSIRIFTKTGKFLGEVYIFPVSKTSNPESKTLDVIIIEEAQSIDDERLKNAVFPMGASTNAPRIYVGTAGYRVCLFKRQLEGNPRAIQISMEKVFADRQKMFELTGDRKHLYYKTFVQHEIDHYGMEDPYIRTQYFGEWILGAGQFTTQEKFDALVIKDMLIPNKSEGDRPCYVGIDTAKHVDQTVVKVIQDQDKDARKSNLIGSLTLRGDNYEDQFDIITDWLKNFNNIHVIALDATGQGDFMPDKFERHTGYNIIRAKFTPEFKDVLYKVLLQVIENKLTRVPYDNGSRDFMQLKQETLDLQREQKGRFMSVHHPEGGDYHDDHPDAWALAEYAKNESIANQPGIISL